MPIKNGAEYIESLRGRKLKIRLFGKWVEEPVDHPMIRPSINAVAETYDLAVEEPELAGAKSSLSGIQVNRFLHIAESAQDLVNQNRMQPQAGPADRYMLSAMRGHGRAQFSLLYYL